MRGRSMPWCTSHYRSSFAREKAKELRQSGKYERVYLGSYLKEYDSRVGERVTYCKIYVVEKAQ